MATIIAYMLSLILRLKKIISLTRWNVSRSHRLLFHEDAHHVLTSQGHTPSYLEEKIRAMSNDGYSKHVWI